MTNFKQGDLCLFNFDPSIGHEYQGKRPAVVIQSDQQIKKSSLITVMPLTSNTERFIGDDIIIKRDDKNRLYSDSVIRVYNIISFDYQRFINKIGDIDDNSLDKIKKYLKKHFNL